VIDLTELIDMEHLDCEQGMRTHAGRAKVRITKAGVEVG